MYSSIAELPIFNEYHNDKLKIINELELNNQANLNISILSNIKHDKEDIKKDNNGINDNINDFNKIDKVNITNIQKHKCKC